MALDKRIEETICELEGDDAETLFHRGELLILQGRYIIAERMFRQALPLYEDSIRHEEEKERAELIIQDLTTVQDDPGSLEFIEKLFPSILEQKLKFDFYAKRASEDPLAPQAYFELAKVKRDTAIFLHGELRKEYLTSAIDDTFFVEWGEPENYENLLFRAELFQELSGEELPARHYRRIEVLRNGVRRNLDSIDQTRYEEQVGDYLKSIRVLEQAIRVNPHRYEGNFERATACETVGVCYAILNDFGKALSYFREAEDGYCNLLKHEGGYCRRLLLSSRRENARGVIRDLEMV